MRYTDPIGRQDDFVERIFIRPKTFPCPHCGKRGRRQFVRTRRVEHVGALNRHSWILVRVGVYKAQCDCRPYFQAPIPGVPYKGKYSYECVTVWPMR